MKKEKKKELPNLYLGWLRKQIEKVMNGIDLDTKDISIVENPPIHWDKNRVK